MNIEKIETRCRDCAFLIEDTEHAITPDHIWCCDSQLNKINGLMFTPCIMVHDCKELNEEEQEEIDNGCAV